MGFEGEAVSKQTHLTPSKASGTGVAAAPGDGLSHPIAFEAPFRVKRKKPLPHVASSLGALQITVVIHNTQKKIDFGGDPFSAPR